MQMKTLACAAALATAAVAAHADNFSPVVPLVPSAGSPGSFSAAFGVTHLLAGAFTDTFTFTGATSGQVFSSLVTIGFLPQNNINLTSVTMNGTALTITGAGTTGLEVASLPVTTFNGPLTLVVAGIAAPSLAVGTAISASYAGTANVSPVPEPGSYAMLLAGLGAVGLVMRRRLPQKEELSVI